MSNSRAWSKRRQAAAANLGTLWLACIACACESRDVPIGGDPGGASAEGGREAGSSGGAQAGAAGIAHTGGRATRPEGGAAEEGGAGGGSSVTTTGGRGDIGSLAGAGGRTPTGGSPQGTSQAGAAGAGGATSPYPLDPTLPLDPHCTCASEAEVCNAAGHCVPRCDEQGRCAAWLVTGPIQSMYAEGSTLYFTTPSETDPLGNPTSLGTLWRVQDSDPRPERVSNAVGLSAHPPSDVSILGRAAGATYVTTYTGTKRTVHEVTDAGAVRLLVDAKILGDPIALSNAVFYMDSAGLWRMRYDADAVPELMVERTGLLGAVAGDNLVWYKSENDPYGNDTYVFDPAASPAEAANSSVGLYIEEDLVGVVGDVGLTSMDGCDVSSYDSTGNLLLHLFSIKNVRKNNEYGESNCESRPYGGWLYVWCGGATSESWSDFDWSLVRSPTSVGRLPQEVLPLEFLTQIAGGSINVDFGWTVGSENVYWVKKTLEPTPQYIFRAPLPPQPCDPDLPCQDTGERCGDDGLCRK